MISDLAELINLMVAVYFRGGWIVFLLGLIAMFYRLYMDHIQITWYRTLEFVFLKITVPRENEKSPLAFEQVLNQLHSLHAELTWAERYLEGRFHIWFTWEVTSIGGVIGNYVRIPKRYRDNLESAIYSQYPDAEITDVEDYFEHLPKYHPDSSDYDIFGFSYYLIKEDAYPIKTYYDFEHSTTETIVDPVAGMWEEMSKINPYEMVVMQYVLRPMGNEWKKQGYRLVKKLKGEREALKAPVDKVAAAIGRLFAPFWDIFIRAEKTERRKPVSELDQPISLMLHLSEGEKNVISAIEKNLAKWGYQTKIHFLYLAPKEKYNPGPVRNALIGASKSFGSADLNSLKPLLKRWTRVNYFIFKNLERPIVELRTRWRKRHHMKFIRQRYFFWGPPPIILNVEELATILHFPSTEVRVPQIERVEVTKVQPPPELPVAEQDIYG